MATQASLLDGIFPFFLSLKVLWVKESSDVEKLGGLNSYLSGSPNSIAILLISDIYGTLSILTNPIFSFILVIKGL